MESNQTNPELPSEALSDANLQRSDSHNSETASPSQKSGGNSKPRLRKKSSFQVRPKEKPMKAVFVTGFNQPLSVCEILPPKPESGEVLIKVEAAPIHASDLGFIKGGYIHLRPPFQVGLEGSGTVVSSGGGFTANWLVGKRVSFGASIAKPGTWAQLIVVPAENCFPIDDNISFEVGACGIINPFTTIGLVETIKKEKFKAVALMTLGSQLSTMMVRFFKREGFKVIVIIANETLRSVYEKIGSDVIIDINEEDFEGHLTREAERLDARCLVEAVCGDITHTVIKGMPVNSTIYIYDHLEREELTQVDFGDLLKNNKIIKSFMFSNWYNEQGYFSKRSTVKKAHDLIFTDLKTDISKVLDMDQIQEAIEYYTNNMGEGKVIIRPNHRADSEAGKEEEEDEAKDEKEEK